MPDELVEVAIARLEGRIELLSERMEQNFVITRDSRSEVKESLDRHGNTLRDLVTLSNEWSGVRKMLAAAGGAIAVLAALSGAILAYWRIGPRP